MQYNSRAIKVPLWEIHNIYKLIIPLFMAYNVVKEKFHQRIRRDWKLERSSGWCWGGTLLLTVWSQGLLLGPLFTCLPQKVDRAKIYIIQEEKCFYSQKIGKSFIQRINSLYQQRKRGEGSLKLFNLVISFSNMFSKFKSILYWRKILLWEVWTAK